MNRLSLLAALAALIVSLPLTGLAADAPVPATLAEIKACIDWLKVPQLPGAQNSRHQFSMSHYKAPGTFAEAVAFFRKSLPALGWAEDATPIPGIDLNTSLYLTFDKAGMRLAVNGYREDPAGPMTITLSLQGNVDARLFPKPTDAQVKSEQRTILYYSTAAKPEDAAAFCRKGIVDLGWTEVKDESADFHAKEGRIVLRFLKNAMEVGVVAWKTPEGTTQVTVSPHVRYTFDPKDVREALTPKEIATPATLKDYTEVIDFRKFPLMDNAKKRDRQKNPIAVSSGLTFQVPGTLENAVKFHVKEFADRGWTEITRDADIENRIEIKFERKGYLVTFGAGQQDKKGDVMVTVSNHGNVDLRQLPWPDGVEIAAERATFINATTSLSDKDATDFYRKALAPLGWKEDKDVRGKGSLEFFQNATLLRFEIGKNAKGLTHLQVRSSLLVAE